MVDWHTDPQLDVWILFKLLIVFDLFDSIPARFLQVILADNHEIDYFSLFHLYIEQETPDDTIEDSMILWLNSGTVDFYHEHRQDRSPNLPSER